MSSKFALVIANTEYQDASLSKLTAPGKDAEEFAQVLRDTKLAAFDDVQVLLNESESKIRRAIARFFVNRNRDDLLLLYFSGHGIRNEQGKLFLAAQDTEINILDASGVPAEFITYAMNGSRSQRQLLILDCCNSGAFAYGTKAVNAVGKSMGIATAFEGSGFGRVVLTATDATQFAWEGDKVIGNTQKSVFTHFLIEGLKGEADRDGDGRIHIDELYDYAYEQVVRSTPKQTPGKWSYKQQGDIVLRENIQPSEVKPAPLPGELLDLLSHPNPNVRKVGIQDLIKLIDGINLGLARAAQDKLREIEQEDDSLTLRKVARAELEARARALEKEIANPPSTEISSDTPAAQKPPLTKVPKIDPKQEKAIASPVLVLPQTGAPPQSNAVPTPAPKITIPSLNWRLLGAIVGGLLVITLCMWGSINLWNNIPAFLPRSTSTFTPTFAPTKTNISTTNTPATIISTETTIPTPSIGSTITVKDGMTLLYVPAGEFTMGSDSGEDNEKPAHTVTLDAFWIDQTEVTNAMFAKFMDETGHKTDAEKAGNSWVNQEGSWKQVAGADWSHPLGPSSGISDIMNHPVVHVSWNDAQAYCSWVNRRLPTEAEWEKVASWDDRKQQKYFYPWGNEFNGNVLNFCDKNCFASWTDKNSDDGYEFTSPVGTYANGASRYGALDMAGNVWEWVEDWYDAYPGNTASDSNYGTIYRARRGGSWYVNINFVGSTFRYWYDPSSASSDIGFRCAMSANP